MNRQREELLDFAQAIRSHANEITTLAQIIMQANSRDRHDRHTVPDTETTRQQIDLLERQARWMINEVERVRAKI